METYAGFAEHADQQVGRLVDALDELERARRHPVRLPARRQRRLGRGRPRGHHPRAPGRARHRRRRRRHGRAASTRSAAPTTYAMYPVGWALAMNTPYQWTKQVASHFGGTRDGLVVHWPGGIERPRRDPAPVPPRHRRAAHRSSTPPGCRCPRPYDGVPQQRVEGTSMRYSFDDPDAEERRRTQYFEMVGNRGIYHEGWTAVTRHGAPVEDDRGAAAVRRRHLGALRHPHRLVARPATSRRSDPERLARAAGALRRGGREAPGLPARRPGHRAGEPRARRSPRPALRPHQMVLGRHTGRLSEEAAPNVKNRSHRIAVDLDIPADHPPQSTNGVLVAQGGRFGGWSLYVVAGRPHYAYNRYGKDLTVVRAGSVLWPGEHEVVLDFSYDGGPPGSGGLATILIDGVRSRAGVDRGDHGVLLRLRRDLQRRHRPRQPGRRRLPAGAQRASPARSAGSSSTSTRAPCWTTRSACPAGQPAPTTERAPSLAGRHPLRRPPW